MHTIYKHAKCFKISNFFKKYIFSSQSLVQNYVISTLILKYMEYTIKPLEIKEICHLNRSNPKIPSDNTKHNFQHMA